ncbi:hypothetical protein [Bradyrhizobium sp. MOS003]|uniref:hypothetical protein n=1 Tax=Bradyrhizobium sp. MOS003 TaxID=2133946 RepID=UPI0011BDB4E4|nr:hypothetical protein [Bradyrhizobium sp. MOS003]
MLRFYLDFATLLVPLALLAALTAAIYVHAKPVYQATGLLDAPKLSLDEWRHLGPLLPDSRLISGTFGQLGWSNSDGSEATPHAAAVRRRFESRTFWEGSLQYRSALRREDVREAPGSDPKASTTLGIDVALRAPGREIATELMNAIARHVGQVLSWSMLDTFLRDRRDATVSRKAELEVMLTKLNFAVTQTETRILDMRQIVDAFPDLRDLGGSTIVSPENGGGRYLSPAAQLVAFKSTLIDQRGQIATAERELDILRWYEQFFARAAAPPDDVRSGSRLADWLDGKRKEFFSKPAGAAVQVDQEIAFAIAEARTRGDRIAYGAAPIVDPWPVTTRAPLPVASIAFVVAMLLFGLLLLIYRSARQLDGPSRTAPWLASKDPLFAWLPPRLRGVLFRYERRYQDKAR